MSGLALFLLGPPRIERDGTLIELDTRKAIALIAYLAVTRQPQSRDALANLLWSEHDQPHARAALRRTLSSLNKALSGNWLDIDRETLGLANRADLWVDVDDFMFHLAQCRTHGHAPSEVCSACISPLSEAVSLYRADFLAGFSLRDSPNFDDWQILQADSFSRDLAGALEALVHCHSAMAEYEPAIAYARRRLALDRLHEPAHRQLMLLYAWAGQRGAAFHQYRECVQVLEQELGVAPLEATTRLYEAIKENRLPPPPAPLSPPAAERSVRETVAYLAGRLPAEATVETNRALAGAQPRSSIPESEPAQFVVSPSLLSSPASIDYPLVGRSEEWSTLLKTYATAAREGGRVILLEGEAGIGKTRLAEELLIYAGNKGATAIRARCYEGETHLAYGPIVTVLRAAIAQQHDAHRLEDVPLSSLNEAALLLPELTSLRSGVQPSPLLDSPGAQSRFFEGIRQLLVTLCSGAHPAIIFVDDLHWADSASLDVLSYLVRRLDEQPFCLLFTWRGKHEARNSRLHPLLTNAQRSGKALVVSLPRLNQSSVRELVQGVINHARTNQTRTVANNHPADALTPAALPEGLVERLYSETEGLPFFLIEYLTAMAKNQLPAESAEWSLPGGVRDLLQSRLNTVSEIGWQLLATAAVIGRSFDFDTLREASGRSEEETVAALEELIAQGLVEEVQGKTGEPDLSYDFSHEKLRSLVYEETSLARRRLLHRRIAEVLAGHARGKREIGSLAGQIAYHYRLAGNEALAAEYFRLAGEHARALYANAEALAHLRLALALGHPDVAALHEAIADVYTLQGEYAAALRSYETTAALCSAEDLVRVEHKLGVVYMRRGEWEAVESHLEAALRTLGESGPASERAKIYADWSLAAHRRGQPDKALDLARQALSLAQAAGDTHALAQAHNILGMLASSQGRLDDARDHLAQSLALAEQLHDPAIRAAALNNLAQAYRASSDIERAVQLTQDALAICVAQGDRHHEAALHSNLADLLHIAGQAEAAMSHLKQAVSIYAEIGVEAGAVQTEIWKLAEW